MEDSIFLEKSENVLANKLLDAYRYWTKKLLLFNILVGLAGLCPIIMSFRTKYLIFDVIVIVCWGFVANIFYSLGYVIESVITVGFKGEKNFEKIRELLFGIGTVTCALAIFSCSFIISK